MALPVRDGAFEAARLVTALHHTPTRSADVVAAGRAASRIIVVQDVYTTGRQCCLTLAADSLINLEFAGHPHSNLNRLDGNDSSAT